MKKTATKGVAMISAILLSGIVSTSTILAAELVSTPEFSAVSNGNIEITQGISKSFSVTLSYADGNSNVIGRLLVDTKYYLVGTQIISDTPKEIAFSGRTLSPTNVEITVDTSKASTTIYSMPINVTIKNEGGNGNGNRLFNEVVDKLSIKVLPSDTTAPVITITNPADGGFYQSIHLPAEPAFTVVDESATTNSFTGWSKEEGRHTLTVSSLDAYLNQGSASIVYTVDNTKPVIMSKLADGGVYNSDTLSALQNNYYSITDQNLITFQAEPLDLSVGEHTVMITAQDKAGNQADKSITYIVDNEVPSILFNFKDGGFYTSSVFKEINPYFSIHDNNLDAAKTKITEPLLLEGTQFMSIDATDFAGNTNHAKSSYTIDDTHPEVDIHLTEGKFYNQLALSAVEEFYTASDLNLFDIKADGFNTEDGVHQASVTAIDLAGNETTKKVKYVIDTTSPAISINADKLANGGFYTSTYLKNLTDFYTVEDVNLDAITPSAFDYEEGTHTFSVMAIDKAGNVATETITYTIDDSAPEILFTLENGGHYQSTNLPVNYFNATDQNRVVSIVSSDEFAATEGTHTLTVIAMDAAGNSKTASVSYTIDDTTPTVTILAPAHGGYYNSENLPKQPSFIVEETNSYTSNIIGWNIVDEATHTATVSATDAAGNIGRATITYTVDNTAPVISSTLVDGGYYNAETLQSLTQYYSVSDAHIEEESVSASDLNLTEGKHKAIIKAVDKAGNATEKIIHYVVDNSKPVILFNFEDGAFYTAKNFKAFAPYYSVTDDNLDESSVLADDTSYTEGENSLTVSASDLAKNTNSATASYIIDDTHPQVSINLVAGEYYNLVALEELGQYWTAMDTHLANVVVSPLETTEGTHTVSVTAVDKAGNTTIASVEYHVDNTAPVIELDEAQLKDGGFYNAGYLQSSGNNPYTIIDANPASAHASSIETEEGTYNYTIVATDKAGNTTLKTISYTVDNTAPHISFKLNENSVYNNATLEAIGQYYNVTEKNGNIVVDADVLVKNVDGSYTLNVVATDLAGNISTAALAYTVDNTNPEIGFQLKNDAHYTTESLIAAVDAGNYFTAKDAYLEKVNADEFATGEGRHTLTVAAIDAAGNKTEASINYVVDNSAPIINSLKGLVEGQRFLQGQDVVITPVATDNFDNNIQMTTSKLDTSKIGKQLVTVSVADQAGNVSTYTMTYHVYSFNGVLDPLKADGKSVFQKNRTVPVKFQISDSNLFVKDASATIHLIKLSGKDSEEEVSTTTTSNATVGNLFRYDLTDNQYIFNLGTKDLEVGQYKVVIAINLDGNTTRKESPIFSIKK